MASDKKTVSAESGKTLQTIYNLWPYMWPADRMDLKMRVVWANVLPSPVQGHPAQRPLFLQMVDGCAERQDGPGGPAADLHARRADAGRRYNVARLVQWGLNQLRDAMFASVGQYAVRQLAFKTFVHLHRLSLRFISNGARAACRGLSSAAPRASRRSSASPSSTRFRR